MHRLWKLLRGGLFKGTALIGGLALIVFIWTINADILVSAEDTNLRLIKFGAHLLPTGWDSKTEAALRLWGADKAFVLIEAGVAVKLFLLALGYPFRRIHRKRKARKEK
jgi:hypothetical protein